MVFVVREFLDDGKRGLDLVLLLVGGDKGSQTKDINRAKDYWAQFLKEIRHGKTK
jgi:putative component of toxin-antitoxin plasmid stabilization module